MRATRRGWNEFWGELLLLRCHRNNPQRWSKREERADWLCEVLPLRSGHKLLDLGCGDGILDICLARKGLNVSAVDRIRPVLDAARSEPGGEQVTFIDGDIRKITLPDSTYDAVLMLDLVGLMSREDDFGLIRNASRWLSPGGVLVVDCPKEPSKTEGESRQEMDDGSLEYHWTYNTKTRLQHIVPTFHAEHGEIIELSDPYDSSREEHVGVLRYLYQRSELHDLLKAAGLGVRPVASHWNEGYYLLIGERGE